MSEYFSDMATQPTAGPPMTETEGGSTIDRSGTDIVVTIDGAKPEPKSGDDSHGENLVDRLDAQEQRKIADKIIEWVKADEQARKHWKERQEDALELLGLKSGEAKDQIFKGSSTVTHPLIAEACVQFQARAIAEIFPPDGPVKTTVVGDTTPDVLAQAKRVEDYLNFHLTEEDPGYFWDTDKMLFELPVSGSLFRKVFKDPVSGLCIGRYVKADDFIVPYSARTLQDAPRYTHRFTMPINDVKRAMDDGTYRECDLGGPSSGETTEARKVADIADDRDGDPHPEDDNRTFFECHCDIEMPWDEDAAFAYPYICTVDRDSSELLSVRRNWEEEDDKKRKQIWFIHYIYLPGLGFYGFGLLHLIGSLGIAATGALRAVLDAAARANFPGGFRAKEARKAGAAVSPAPGEWLDIEMPAELLAKAFFPLPYKEPSAGLMEILKQMVEAGQRFSSTTEQMVGEAANTGPVGTTMALIEQGSKVFSAIHKRLHVALRDEFRLLSELIADQMDEVYPYSVGGKPREIMRKDFDERVDVIPVSDPTLASTTQRIAMAQEVLKLVSENPDVFDSNAKREANRRMLEALKAQNIDALLPGRKTHRLDPVSENQLLITGKPVGAYPEQDHLSHLAAHQTFFQGLPPEMQKPLQPVILAHLAEHYAYQYKNQVQQQTGMLPPFDMDQDIKDVSPQIDAMIAQAVAQIHPQMLQLPGMGPQPLPPEVQQQMQQMQQQLQQAQQELQKFQQGSAAELQKLQQAKGQLDQQMVATDLRAAKLSGQLDQEKMSVNLRTQEQMANLAKAQSDLQMQQAALQAATEKFQLDMQMQQQQLQAAAEKAKSNIDRGVGKLQNLADNLNTRLTANEADKQATDKKTAAKEQQDVGKILKETMGPIEELMKALTAPREITIERGADGRATGAKSVAKTP